MRVAILLSAFELRKSFGHRSLFDRVSFSIESGERVGLIGPNGAGKSTLLRILASQISPDHGMLSLQKGLKIGYLEQVPAFEKNATIHSAILKGALDPHDDRTIALSYEISSKLSLGDSFSLVENLSGGWKKRVALARELIKSPDLLLLDEPTNHLDLESIFWLENFLSNAPFATLTVTHDRQFLEKISTRILELDKRNVGGLLSVRGNYSSYLKVKEQLISSQEQQELKLKNTLRRESEWLKRGAKARTTKQYARIQRAGDLKNDLEELEYRNQVRTARLEFQFAEKNPKKLIEAKKISKNYGGNQIFNHLDLLISPGDRIGILGQNGSGKSTLIRTLIGEEDLSDGSIIRAENLSVAYFEQNRETLDPALSIIKTLCPYGEFVEYRGQRIHIRSYLDRFLFSSDQMNIALGKLSGGEQSRVLIAQLMLKSANLLVLDEPTNDLDIPTLNVLEDCLIDFPGAVLLVTHDRYFLDRVSNRILSFESLNKDGKKINSIVSFSDLIQWENWKKEQSEPNEKVLKDVKPLASSVKVSSKKRRLGFKEQRELDSMEANIQHAEARLLQLSIESSSPENATNSVRLLEIAKEMSLLQCEIDRLYSRWAELEQS